MEKNIDCVFINDFEESNFKIYKFDDTKDIYDIISYFLEIKSSNDHFYIVNLTRIESQWNKWRKELPTVKPYYAVKSNPDPMILKTLSKLGSCFDCASKSEIIEVLSHVEGDSIIYANPCKEITHLQYARAHDVDLLTFDSETELYKIKLHHPNARLLIRIKVDDSSSKCKFSSKFGVDPEEAYEMIALLYKLDLELVGTSFHVGSNCEKSGFYQKAIKNCRDIFDHVQEKYEKRLELLDIGGGFPGNDSGAISFAEIASEIRKSLNEHFHDGFTKVIAEPGRFFSTQSHILVSSVIGTKKKRNVDSINFQYTINEGIYGSFSAIVFDHATPDIKPFSERHEKKTYKSTIFGPTCDSIDMISDDILLPQLTVGDWIFAENFGAYTRASSTTFNGFQPGKVYYIVSDNDNV